MPLPAHYSSDLERRYPGFSSFKTTSPIHYSRRWLRDVLIQVTLDPIVSTISPLSPPRVDEALDAEFGFSALINAQDVVVLVTTEFHTAPLPPSVVLLSRPEVQREPFLTTGRSIWRHKNVHVDIEEIESARKSAAKRATFGDLIEGVSGPSEMKSSKILSMIANGHLLISLADQLNLNSPVLLGPAPIPVRSLSSLSQSQDSRRALGGRNFHLISGCNAGKHSDL